MGLFDGIKAQIGMVQGTVKGIREAVDSDRKGADVVGCVLHNALAGAGKAAFGVESPSYDEAKRMSKEQKKSYKEKTNE